MELSNFDKILVILTFACDFVLEFLSFLTLIYVVEYSCVSTTRPYCKIFYDGHTEAEIKFANFWFLKNFWELLLSAEDLENQFDQKYAVLARKREIEQGIRQYRQGRRLE